MARPDKEAAVAELTEDFRSATATVLTEYRGLSVTSMKELRRALGDKTKYSVVKNTLTKIAAKNAGVDLSPELLVGPSAVAFIKGDAIDAAKSLRDFAKENPFLVIKGGIYEGKAVTKEELMQLANLESREVLLAKLAGAMKGSLAKAARIFDALRIKLASEESTNSAVSEVPAQAVITEDVVVIEEVPAEAVVSEAPTVDAVSEVPAEAVTTDVVSEELTTSTEEKE